MQLDVDQPQPSAPYRLVRFAPRAVEIELDSGGVIYLRSPVRLGNTERSLTKYLAKWAADSPDRTFLGQMNGESEWRTLSYRQAFLQVRRIGSRLLSRGLGPERGIVILSGNSIEHGLLTLAGMAVGIPVAPISPNYSTQPGGQGRLQEIASVFKPYLVFAQDSHAHSLARSVEGFDRCEWVSVVPRADSTNWIDLLQPESLAAFDEAEAGVGPDTIAKILFTSGSTGSPKGVINTQRMLCSVAEMSSLLIAPIEESVQVEWMPWHHTMGGNAGFGSALRNGASLYIDDGRPTPALFSKTIKSLKAISPTSLQTVPAGFSMLVDALKEDACLRRSFFKRIQRVSCGGAALRDGLIQEFQQIAMSTVGERIAVLSGYGATEAGPSICVTNWPCEQSGELGLPLPGVQVKLVPFQDRYEIRIKGPNVTPGYLGRPDLTHEAFDESGYYRVGDAVTLVDDNRPELGLKFAGRLSENFKLGSGTWVLAGELRLEILAATSPALTDLVLVGENESYLAVLGWPNPNVPLSILSEPSARDDHRLLARDSGLRRFVCNALVRYNAGKPSSMRIERVVLLEEPASSAAGEITDKGYINQRAAIKVRADLVMRLFSEVTDECVIVIPKSESVN